MKHKQMTSAEKIYTDRYGHQNQSRFKHANKMKQDLGTSKEQTQLSNDESIGSN